MKNLVQRSFLSCLIIIITTMSYAGNHLPILTWPGTGTYKSDGLDPEVGVDGTTFTFRVKYIDYDNEAPAGDVMVVISSEEEPMGFAMTPENSSRDYRKGVIYRYATSTLASKTYSYYFEIATADGSQKINIANRSDENGATDNLQEADRLSPASTKQGPEVASDQILGWLGSGTYESGGVYPANGGTNTVFTYRVKCFGTLSPEYPILAITNSSAEEATYTMKPEGGTPTNGSVYSATHTFSAADKVGYTYSFIATEYRSKSLAGNGPNIYPNGAGVSAFLDWTGKPGYEDDGVEPDIASHGATFTYRIKYVNVDGKPPDPGYPTIGIGGEFPQMNLVSGTSTTGIIYQYQVVPSYSDRTITENIIAMVDGFQISSESINFWATNIPPLLTWTGEQ
ncbi:MAG: hypothetical protein AAB296_02725, partial [Candidatus Desantisbacteria bacterium]